MQTQPDPASYVDPMRKQGLHEIYRIHKKYVKLKN